MERHLHLFETESEFNEVYNGSGYTDPWVSYTKETSGVTYNKAVQPPHDYSQDYLTFVMLEDDGTVSTSDDYVYLSSDNGQTWTQEVTGLSAGDKVLAKGTGDYFTSSDPPFSCNVRFNVEGNIMSICDETGFRTRTTLDTELGGIFCNMTTLISAENLVLPATTLAENCYNNMFYGCESLTTAPELPATTLTYGCYSNMFEGCTSLTTAPELPATTLASYCYSYMFGGCSSLTTTPELPATTLASYCYYQMFYGCTSLTTAPELPATTLAQECYCYMFSGCTSLTTAPTSIGTSATTMPSSACTQMFYGCTSLTTAPELPATTLAESCYYQMFYGCESLTTAPELPATTLAESCYYQMFVQCWLLNYIKCLATDISANDCTTGWLSGVSSDGTFVKNPNMNDWELDSDNGIPYDWTVQDAS